MSQFSHLVKEMKCLKNKEIASILWNKHKEGSYKQGDITRLVKRYKVKYPFISRTGVNYHLRCFCLHDTGVILNVSDNHVRDISLNSRGTRSTTTLQLLDCTTVDLNDVPDVQVVAEDIVTRRKMLVNKY